MAETPRNINVTLKANVDQYVEAMERARVSTEALANELRACGISEAELPKAMKTALRIIKDEDGEPKFAVGL